MARLVDTVGNEHQQYVDGDQRFHFAGSAGSYSLVIESGYTQSNLVVDGRNGIEVQFAELLPAWEAEVSQAGSMPGYSLVRVEVEGMKQLPVHIWKEDWEGMVRKTGSKPEYGPYVLEFSPLSPGHYMIEPEGLGLWAEVELTGLEALWVHFRKETAPLGPNRILPMARPESTTLPQAPVVEPQTQVASPANAAETIATAPAETTTAAALPNLQATQKSTHYLFLYDLPKDVDELAKLLRYTTCEQPQIGRDRWAAFDAEQVTIVGGQADTMALREFVHALEAAGVTVQYLPDLPDPSAE
ncbi:MAG: hypothetical protein R2867_09295 [Caldilineaceae bacterium]